MATHRHPSPFLPRWLFWSESLLLVIITALATFFVLNDDPLLPFVWYGISVVAPSCIVGFSTVFFFALRNRQIKKSFQMGALIVFTGEFIAIFVNTLLVNAIWQALRPSCQIECGNSAIIATLEIFWPIMSMLLGIAAAGFASLLGWIVLRLHRGQESQVKAENG
jgi:hypothetical protein